MSQRKTELLENVANSIKAYCDACHDFKFQPDNPVVRLHEPSFGDEEIFRATETMLSTFVTMGKKVRAFEQQYAQTMGHQYGVMNNSGSSANLLAISALTSPLIDDRLCPGDEILVPALSWSTTVWPLIQHQLVPVFVDCDLDTFNFDMAQLEAAITPKTRAIMPVHVYGNPCDMDALMSLASKHQLMVIEDSCESMGASYDGKSVGSFGRVGTFSFYYSHHITTLEGGMCVTDDYQLTEVMRIRRAHGWSREAEQHQQYVDKHPEIDPRFIFVDLGYNLRPTELQGAMGQVQLPKLAGFVDSRRETAACYLQGLEKYAEYFSFQQETPKGRHAWFGFPIILKPSAPFSVAQITEFLQAQHIETRPVIAGNMARHPALANYEHRIAGSLKNADTVMEYGFAIGNHHGIDAAARAYVLQVFDNFFATQLSATATSQLTGVSE